MIFKKHKKTVFDVELTSAEKRVLDEEIRKEAAEFYRKSMIEIDAIVIWELYQQLDLDEADLKQFFDGFNDTLQNLLDHYEMGSDAADWLCTNRLLAEGIDILAWEKEAEEELGKAK